jgi:Na+/H+ antiporter NhaD/arsenite permease-like protein
MNITLERPARLLVLSNLVTIVIALVQGWSASEVMWIYWAQSIVIGFFNVLRMFRLHEFSTDGVKMNDRPVQPTPSTRRSMATFFAFHYGFFHFIYFFFLAADGALPRGTELISFAVCIAAFVVNHTVSFRENVEEDLKRRPNIGSMMFFPYLRIIPMHLTIILGGIFPRESRWVLLLFLSLKTVADLAMHLVEHGKFTVSTQAAESAE